MTKTKESNKEQIKDTQPEETQLGLATTRKFFAPTAGATVAAKDATQAAAAATKSMKDIEVGDGNI